MRSPAVAVLVLLTVWLQVALSDVCGRKSVRDIWHGECAEPVAWKAVLSIARALTVRTQARGSRAGRMSLIFLL